MEIKHHLLKLAKKIQTVDFEEFTLISYPDVKNSVSFQFTVSQHDRLTRVSFSAFVCALMHCEGEMSACTEHFLRPRLAVCQCVSCACYGEMRHTTERRGSKRIQRSF